MHVVHLTDVRTFVAVAGAGSISRASAELHLTQPAVTRSLQRLEDALGAPLLERRVRPLKLTEFGFRALDRCNDLLAAAGAVDLLKSESTSPAGELRVGVAHALSQTVLMDPVERLQREFPRITLRVESAWSRELLGRIKAGSLDAAVLLWPEGSEPSGSFLARRFGGERIALIASRRDGSERRRRPADFDGTPWVLSPEGCAARQGLRQALASHRVAMHVAVESFNYELQMALVARGRGFGAVPARLLRASRHRARLRTLSVPGLELPFGLWFVNRRVPGSLADVVRVLSARVAESFGPKARRS
jgi:DNA-binding transcriptional LysR family regulator